MPIDEPKVTERDPSQSRRPKRRRTVMHGAWAFDLLLLVFTGLATVVTFRQLTMEHDESE